MRTLIKDIIFLIIFFVILHFVSKIMVLNHYAYGTDVISFYNLPKNSLNMMFFGSSHCYATFSPEIIKKKTNLSSYNFATQQQPIYITYHYMLESLKYQKPKYFVLEAHMLVIDWDYASEGITRDAIDRMRFSLNKIATINDSVEDFYERFSYYFNIIKYHGRYNEITKEQIMDALKNVSHSPTGYTALPSKMAYVPNNSDVLDYLDEVSISAKNLEYLEKIIALVKKNNIELIIVQAPAKINKEYQEKYNWLEKYLANNDIKYINYNRMFDELDFEADDFYDVGHLSKFGAEKVCINFSNFLKDNYLHDYVPGV